MSDWENPYEGYVLDGKAVEQKISEYEEETYSTFIILKKDKLFGSSLEGESRCLEQSRSKHLP